MQKLICGITQIGNQLVNCTNGCSGVNNNLKPGIIPRTLYLEYKNRPETVGCVVVGINPGIGNAKEIQYYIDNGGTYQSLLNYWQQDGCKNPYYTRLRDLISCLGYSGPILWTELVKCEKLNQSTTLPLQTFRTCSNNFLTKEMQLVPNDWIIIAVGQESRRVLAYLYPTRSIIGVPHPTSSRGNFARLFANSTRNSFTPKVQQKVCNFKNNPGIEVWLG